MFFAKVLIPRIWGWQGEVHLEEIISNRDTICEETQTKIVRPWFDAPKGIAVLVATCRLALDPKTGEIGSKPIIDRFFFFRGWARYRFFFLPGLGKI